MVVSLHSSTSELNCFARRKMSAMSCCYSSATVFSLTCSRRRRPSILSVSISPPAESGQDFSFSALQLWTRRRMPISTYCTTSSTSAFDLSPPPIDQDLLETVTVAGAKLSDDGIVETFNNDDEALEASENGVVVVDLSHYGRIRVSGEDRIQFLHNQSTADFESLHEGQGCDTVFVTPTARTIDLVHAWVMKNAVTLVVSPVTNQSLIQMLGKYIFSADKVEIQDITKQTCLFALIGPKSNQVMEELNLGDLIGQPYGTHSHYTVNEMPITVSVGNPISEEGFSLLTIPGAAESVWKTLLSLGSVPMGTNAFERLRISQGRPEPGKELTNEYNVLEAHLWNAVSLNKGCYKGQETIARLVTYDGIKQRLWGLSLSSPVEPGSAITVDGKKVGKVTSYAKGRKKEEHLGLGYIKRQGASEGDNVVVGDNIPATVVEVPFLANQRLPPSTSKRPTLQ